MSKKEKDLQETEKAPEAKKNDAPRKKVQQDKNKKPNWFVRQGRKIKETFSELKRVTWPTFGKALKATGVVLVSGLIFTVIVTGSNYGLAELLDLMVSTGA